MAYADRPTPLLLDPSLFTLPFDVHFARALAAEGAAVHLAGRPLRAYERLAAEPFTFHPLFYRLGEGSRVSWRSSPVRRAVKALEHVFGHLGVTRLVTRERIDVLHVQWLALPLVDRPFLARLRPQLRLFITVHNADLLPHDTRSLAGRLLATGRKELLDLFDGFVAHTGKTVRHLEGLGVNRGRILLAPHPPLALDGPADHPQTAADGPPRILFFGAIKPYKGVDLLVNAALELAARGRDFHLAVVGRPFLDMAPVLERIRAAGAARHFTFELDYVPDERLDQLLREAAVVVFPYREIDGSGAMALAASYGKAIVASRVGMFAEPPVASRVALVEPGDVAGLAETLDRLVTDAAAQAELTKRGTELACELGDWRSYARACLDFYEAARSSR